jgi:hypothetical protein
MKLLTLSKNKLQRSDDMREILFRGKLRNDINPQKPAGSWVYGAYVIWKHGACIFEADAVLGLYVILETVGQWTGLTDKNGKRFSRGIL